MRIPVANAARANEAMAVMTGSGVSGKGFIAMDMGFRNTTGGIKEQPVVLRSSSVFSVFYRCSFNAFHPFKKRFAFPSLLVLEIYASSDL
ncbi:pectinesterase 3 [Artemisia annua]|uniref:Pectinesterase 3 n=1 Tax=Artemisia annua TaxID=35608 RepID=A0A2U1NFB5_ARTAN|nr:pectinesterase 3 [Artemisia annua]